MTQKDVSIVTFNVQGHPIFSADTYIRLSKIGAVLNSLDLDVINLQEVLTYGHFLILKRYLVNFPYYSFERFFFGPKGGAVTFSRFPIKKIKYIPFSFQSVFTPKIFLSRGVLVSQINDTPIAIINTHLTANTDNDWSSTNRYFPVHKAEIANLKEIIKSAKVYKFMFICGDFNIAKASLLYKELKGMLKVQDIFERYNFPTYHQEFMNMKGGANRIDYMFVKSRGNKRFKVLSTNHLFEKKLKIKYNKGFFSDHIALKASVEINL